MASHDLSAYELLRLENIRRNNEFLASLGIEQHKPVVVKKEVIQQIKTPKRSIKSDRIETQPQRSSKRIKGLTPVKYENNDEEVADADPNLAPDEVEGINYEAMPEESDQLDDFEFEAFVELRKWRLYRMRALRIEPFKIFPNKTLCQLIRKRRNDVCWAADAAVKVEPAGQTASTETTPSGEQPGSTATGSVLTSQAEEEDNSLQDVSPTAFSESISHDLVSCFGIGPSKVKAGGFAWEALTVLNRTSISCLLEKSRNLNSG